MFHKYFGFKYGQFGSYKGNVPRVSRSRVEFTVGQGRLQQVIPLLCKTVVTWACPGQHCCSNMGITLLLDGLFDCEWWLG